MGHPSTPVLLNNNIKLAWSAGTKTSEEMLYMVGEESDLRIQMAVKMPKIPG